MTAQRAAASVLLIICGAGLIRVFWATFAQVFNEAADNEDIVYLVAGGIPVLVGVLLAGAGLANLVRRG